MWSAYAFAVLALVMASVVCVCCVNHHPLPIGKYSTPGVAESGIGRPFLLCDLNQKFSEGHGSVESYIIAAERLGVVEEELIPDEGIGSSVCWWADVHQYRASTGIWWDRCFTGFVKSQEQDYISIDARRFLVLLSVEGGSMMVTRYTDCEGLQCRSVEERGGEKGLSICRGGSAASANENWHKLLNAGDRLIYNASLPHSFAILSPFVVHTFCVLRL